MQDPFRQALSRKRIQRGHVVVEEPTERLVWGVKFAVAMIGFLSGLETLHVLYFGIWNSEVFSAITGLIGTVSGVLIGSHA